MTEQVQPVQPTLWWYPPVVMSPLHAYYRHQDTEILDLLLLVPAGAPHLSCPTERSRPRQRPAPRTQQPLHHLHGVCFDSSLSVPPLALRSGSRESTPYTLQREPAHCHCHRRRSSDSNCALLTERGLLRSMSSIANPPLTEMSYLYFSMPACCAHNHLTLYLL